MPARQIFLERDDVADLESPALHRDLAELLDDADVLVTEDARRRPWPSRYLPTSLPQMPAHRTRMIPASGGISGSGISRSSVARLATWTAARDVVAVMGGLLYTVTIRSAARTGFCSWPYLKAMSRIGCIIRGSSVVANVARAIVLILS